MSGAHNSVAAVILMGLLAVTVAATDCNTTGDGRIPRADNCAGYTICTNNSITGTGECPYPQLFSSDAMTCQDFATVNCSDRIEPQAPCDYQANQCASEDPSCVPCQRRLPSCVGETDGHQAFTGREWTPFYVTCFRNRTLNVTKCATGFFHPKMKTCVTEIGVDDSHAFCLANPLDVVPVPDNCAKFYNCSTAHASKSVVQECTYPDLYSKETRTCQNFTSVDCEARWEPQAPCDYEQNQCRVVSCVPCPDRFPSCVGLPDGRNPFPNRLWKPYYVVCNSNRTTKAGMCSSGFFNPVTKRCEDFLQKEYALQFCKDSPYEIVPSPDNCAQYYNCSAYFDKDPQAIFQECHYPTAFSSASRGCQQIAKVNCSGRGIPNSVEGDPCKSKPCVHGACAVHLDTYRCTCSSGFTGRNCDISHDPCMSNPCLHGKCESQLLQYKCTCNPGYQGKLCDTEIDACKSSPCVHGSCSSSLGVFRCFCYHGYAGRTCSVETDECLSNPCLYGTCVDGHLNYTCHCMPGVTGRNCDTAAPIKTTSQHTSTTVSMTSTSATSASTAKTTMPTIMAATNTMATVALPGCPDFPLGCPKRPECNSMDQNNCPVCTCGVVNSAALPSCPSIRGCMLDCPYKQDGNGCDVCECAHEQHLG